MRYEDSARDAQRFVREEIRDEDGEFVAFAK